MASLQAGISARADRRAPGLIYNGGSEACEQGACGGIMRAEPPTCVGCGRQLLVETRFCPSCGRPVEIEPDAVLLPQPVRLTGDRLDTRELLALVEAGVAHWRQQLLSGSATTRAQAAQAIDDLSRILRSLAAQLAGGRATVRITSRLPVLRAYPAGCSVCGRGNRAGARFCQHCGAALSLEQPAPAKRNSMANLGWRYRIGALSDVGRVRVLNEDTCYVGELPLDDQNIAVLCLVADGMGGAKAGEEASRLAAEALRQQLAGTLKGVAASSDEEWQGLLRTAASRANRRVYQESQTNAEQRGMGTTLTAALLIGDRAQIAQVGDSRAYLFNQSGITADGAAHAQLTNDHSLVARLVDIGQITAEEARTHPQKHMLYRSLGTDPSVDIDTFSQSLQNGDVLLLCSDGLTNHVDDHELAQIVLGNDDPDAACAALVALANERGGRDNISAIVVRVEHS